MQRRFDALMVDGGGLILSKKFLVNIGNVNIGGPIITLLNRWVIVIFWRMKSHL